MTLPAADIVELEGGALLRRLTANGRELYGPNLQLNHSSSVPSRTMFTAPPAAVEPGMTLGKQVRLEFSTPSLVDSPLNSH
jgi:hypothetical protein